MWMLIPLLLVPLFVMGAFRVFNRSAFTVKEFLVLELVMVLLLLGGFQAARYGALADTELWNGRITDKDEGTEGCCHCRTVCDAHDKKGRCTVSHRVCDHFHDYWWSLDVSTGDVVRDGCSGSSRDPAWWADAYVGEPASIPHSYINYLLADPDSILVQESAGDAGDAEVSAAVPVYPEVFNRFQVTRFFTGQTRAPGGRWDAALDEINADLGGKKEVNIIVIATTDASPTFADAVERDWIFGKKNDVIFVLGAPDGDTVAWAKVITISDVEMLRLTARDELPGKSLSDVEGTSAYIRKLVEDQFARTPMDKYEYLWASAQPSTVMTVVLYVLAVVGAVGGSLIMVHTDMFGDEQRRYRYDREEREKGKRSVFGRRSSKFWGLP